MKRGILLILVFLSCGALLAESGFYSRDNLVAFADHLFSAGDYDRAIGEYLRAAAHCEDDCRPDSLWYRIAVAYLLRGGYADSRRFIRRIGSATDDTVLAAKAECLLSFSFYTEKKYDSAVAVPLVTGAVPGWQERSQQIRLASLLQQYRWADVAADTVRLPADSLTRVLHDIAEAGNRLKLKSPAAAGLLSALVPGSGKLYSGRGWDGLYSFLLVGITAWQSFEGYRKDGPFSIRTMVFGALAGVFYTGNIYGSVHAAQQHNQTRRGNLAYRVTLPFNWLELQ